MKKSKLIATLCTLILTLACLTFGVYSAVKTTFTASGTITFNAYGINLDIDMSFAGTGTAIGNKYVSTHTGRSEHLSSGQTYTEISAGVTGLDLTFDELTIPEGKTEPELKITMTLNVKNYSGYPIMAIPTLKFGASGAETTETFDGTFTKTLTNGVVNLADQGTAAITITISPKNPATAITSNNNFKFEFEFAPYNYNSYYTSQGYTLLENGKDGITISSGALSGQYTGSATKIMIPESVTSIGPAAFFNCSSLTSIAIPEGVASIGGRAFDSCSSLTSITIPSSVTNIEYVMNPPFYNCGNLTSIIVESGNTVYDSRDNCNAIIEKSTNTLIRGCNTTTIPSGVTSIGKLAFSDCSSLTSITITNSVTTIDERAFFRCESLTTITIPSSVTRIGNSAFQNCSSLTTIAIPSSVTSISDSAFNGCSSLTSITIPESVTNIGSGAFSYCSKLTTVTIPESVTNIGSSAFSYCSKLTTVTIPEGVTSIGVRAFSSCSSLTKITCNSASVGTQSIGLSLYFTPTGGTTKTNVSSWQTKSGVYTKT